MGTSFRCNDFWDCLAGQALPITYDWWIVYEEKEGKKWIWGDARTLPYTRRPTNVDSVANVNLRSGPSLAVLIRSLLRSRAKTGLSFRFALPAGMYKAKRKWSLSGLSERPSRDCNISYSDSLSARAGNTFFLFPCSVAICKVLTSREMVRWLLQFEGFFLPRARKC